MSNISSLVLESLLLSLFGSLDWMEQMEDVPNVLPKRFGTAWTLSHYVPSSLSNLGCAEPSLLWHCLHIGF